MNKKTFWIIGILVLVGIVYVLAAPSKPGQYDTFATCLGEQGAIFYGAFWCPHCRDQKALFGRSASKLPYIECSTPDGQGQTPKCTELGIESYPTWEFADGERVGGVLTLETLAERTSCPLTIE